jgi:hypothetical protein
MMFRVRDHGAILGKETGLKTPKIVRFVIGNPLVMKENGKARTRCWILRSGHNSGG